MLPICEVRMEDHSSHEQPKQGIMIYLFIHLHSILFFVIYLFIHFYFILFVEVLFDVRHPPAAYWHWNRYK